MKFHVYIIQNKINYKIYVGKTNNPKKRFSKHLEIARRGFSIRKEFFGLVHKAIVKYGENNFSFLVLESYDIEGECLEAEKFWIEYFRTNVNKFGMNCGYNLTAGGDGISGYKMSQDAKNKISEKLSGRKLTNTHKNRISTALSGNFNVNLKITWPDDDKLLEMVQLSNFTRVANLLNVSDNAVRGRLKRRGLI